MSARRISIIIPARNEAAQIRGTIEAALAAVDELRRAETATFLEACATEADPAGRQRQHRCNGRSDCRLG